MDVIGDGDRRGDRDPEAVPDGGGHPPTTVVLPTTQWTEACAAVAGQLGSEDELLAVCDDHADPLADRAADDTLPAGVRAVVAGDPEGCSGKANALVAGMRAGEHDRVVWTDGDFRRPPEWLTGLHAAYDRHGPVTELPFFVGRDPLSVLLEPAYMVGGTLATYAGRLAWGGPVVFERDDLDCEALLGDLGRTVGDGSVLTDHVDVTSLRRVRTVPAGGSVRESLERHVRFTKTLQRYDPAAFGGLWVAATVAAAACVAFPIGAAILVTAFQTALYAVFGVRRWTALLAYPATLAQVPLLAYSTARRTFVWGGRRYRWRDAFEVTVLTDD